MLLFRGISLSLATYMHALTLHSFGFMMLFAMTVAFSVDWNAQEAVLSGVNHHPPHILPHWPCPRL